MHNVVRPSVQLQVAVKLGYFSMVSTSLGLCANPAACVQDSEEPKSEINEKLIDHRHERVVQHSLHEGATDHCVPLWRVIIEITVKQSSERLTDITQISIGQSQ